MDIKAIKEKYDNNVPLKEIAKKHHITLNKLNSIIKTQDWHRKRRGGTKGNKAIAFVGTSGVQLGWLASQADMLAEDWKIVEN